MAALSFRSPTDTEQYRDSTATHRAMAGVTGPSFRCVKCKQVRSTKGRRAVIKGYSRAGYRCRECAR